jgi:TonB-dependent receptor-like protein
VNVSYAGDREVFGPLDPGSELETRSPLGGIELSTLQFSGFGGFPFPITDQTVQFIRSNGTCPDATSSSGGSCKVPLLLRSDLRNSQPYRMNPYGFLSGNWWTSGLDQPGTLRHENRYRVYGQADWQANRYHRFNFGGEYNKSDLAYWSSSMITQIFMDAYVVHPWYWSAWAADRLDLGDVVLQFGLRYDRMNYDALFANTPGRIFSYKVCYNFAASCPSADSVATFSPSAGTNAAAYDSGLARAFTPSVSHGTLSPRLGVSFPITDRTNFRLSYSHQVNRPDFNAALSGTNNDLSFTNTNDSFGRDITFGKTILFEFGVRHAFNPDLVLDVSAYNKNFVSEPAYRIRAFPDPAFPGKTVNVNILTNADFGYARGVDVTLDRRVGNWLNASVAYTLQVSQSTGSDPFSYLNTSARQVQAVSGDRLPPSEQARTTDNNREHNIVGTIALTVPPDWQQGSALGAALHDVGVFATFRAVSGLPYTRLQNTGGSNDPTNPSLAPREGFGLESNSIEPINSSTMPWIKNLDIRVNKGFRIGRMDWQLFADARNVLNFQNVVRLFTETGDVVNGRNRANVLATEFANLDAEARANNAFAANGDVALPTDCSAWAPSPVNCVMLQRTEMRWGNGDGLFTLDEQRRAFNAEYNLLLGVQTMYGPPRTIRIGAELNF